MRRSNGYTPRQNSGWDTTSQDYRAHLARMERQPTMIPGASQYPTVHKAFNNKYSSEEEVVEFKEEHHQKQRSPKSEKKVQIVEHVETIEETTDGNYEVHEETTVDVEAGGYIQQKHKAFELCKWKTFKVH
ncbi:Uncharacterized protein TCM_012229 [Theobroma cacao]|uniref:Uncharacterized protein n=1 Tax=Theobroma cacao TaxID=3641 RepID=A0A061FTW8_THECC|nr:Uncharacterized protein TCM_012229 [Theobroma cacao]